MAGASPVVASRIVAILSTFYFSLSSFPRPSFVHESKRAWTGHVLRAQIHNREPRVAHEIVHLAIQMTAPGERTPERRETILPFPDTSIRREPMLDKNERAVRLQHAPHLAERGCRIV